MNPNFSKTNFQNKKMLFTHMFLIPPNQYASFMKKVYQKFKNSNVPKTLRELKRFALEEAKNISKKLHVKKQKQNDEFVLMEKDDIIKVLKALYNAINPMFIKINNNFKNERRKVFENDSEYINILKSFELKKIELIKYLLRKTCEMMSITYNNLESNILQFIEKKEVEVIEAVNSFTRVGKSFALAPKHLQEDEILEILKMYYTNLEYFVNNKEQNNFTKYALILIDDIIYSNYGLEEEQIYLKIQENNFLETNSEIKKYVDKINDLITENLIEIFDL